MGLSLLGVCSIPSFLVPLWFLGSVVLCVACGKILWDPDRYGHWWIHVKCVSCMKTLDLKMEMGYCGRTTLQERGKHSWPLISA